MANNPRKLIRYLSEQYQNYGYIDEQSNEMKQSIKSTFKIPMKNFLRQISGEVKEKIDRLEQGTQIVNKVLQQPTFTSLISTDKDRETNQHTIIETGITHRETKSGSQRLRWNLLFNLLLWIVIPLPFWIPFISNQVALYLLPSMHAIFVLMWVVITILALRNVLILYMNRSQNYTEKIAKLEKKPIRHIVAISCYKEPIELIVTSVQSVANQTEVHRITLVVSFEEKTPDKEEKCKYLQNKFEHAGFEQIIFTIHPRGLPNEIPGKCSNSNYGLRMAVNQMNIINDDDMKNILVTTCDADSKFPSNYIAALTWKYLEEKQPALTTVYQSPLFYNWKLDSLSFVTRVTGLLRSLLMLGALIPFNINTMSIFSFSLSLAKKGNFIHPGYQMDDIICLIRWMGVTQQRLRISMIPVPVVSGPTSGETIEIEIMEWARQARRWTIGAAEVFHYFIIKAKHIPKIAAFSWGFVFIIYYGVLLCSAGLFNFASTISMLLLVKNVPPTITYIMYGLFGLQMLTFLVAFIIDTIIVRLINVHEFIFILRNIFHFISTPFVLVAYSLVELYALHEVVIFGKKVCKHGASAKNVLN
ncbi:unnamed protein product [Adineta steineri]|uniref:Glycosyltransferase 2-like domain-containing protein n=2 Tax=Adineta steineri TaxID=433720 RepID=A0A818VPS6_9BILA|nr:unnamed protein product [Adineta steineri]CAF3714207.1 unnamed protein product [Adineta steineri]